jgi:hypothetical protein
MGKRDVFSHRDAFLVQYELWHLYIMDNKDENFLKMGFGYHALWLNVLLTKRKINTFFY